MAAGAVGRALPGFREALRFVTVFLDQAPHQIGRHVREAHITRLKQVTLSILIALAASAADAGKWVEGTVTHVRDVDTIEVSGLAIRLNGLDGPELDEKTGRAGKRWMQKLVLRKQLRCWLNGDKTYDRWVGTCYLPDKSDIAALAVSEGLARDCPRFSGGRYARFETPEARALPQHGYCR